MKSLQLETGQTWGTISPYHPQTRCSLLNMRLCPAGCVFAVALFFGAAILKTFNQSCCHNSKVRKYLSLGSHCTVAGNLQIMNIIKVSLDKIFRVTEGNKQNPVFQICSLGLLLNNSLGTGHISRYTDCCFVSLIAGHSYGTVRYLEAWTHPQW